MNLTKEDCDLISLLLEERRMLKVQLDNLTNRKIAEKFDVSERTITRIAKYGVTKRDYHGRRIGNEVRFICG